MSWLIKILERERDSIKAAIFQNQSYLEELQGKVRVTEETLTTLDIRFTEINQHLEGLVSTPPSSSAP